LTIRKAAKNHSFLSSAIFEKSDGCQRRKNRDISGVLPYRAAGRKSKKPEIYGGPSDFMKNMNRETPKSSVRRERRTGGFGVGRNGEEVCDVCFSV
jgi:hypothetical protein